MGYRNPLTVLGRGVIIVGSLIETAYTGARIALGGGTVDPLNNPALAFYSGQPAETNPGRIALQIVPDAGPAHQETLNIDSSTTSVGGSPARVALVAAGTTGVSQVVLTAANIKLTPTGAQTIAGGGYVQIGGGGLFPKTIAQAVPLNATLWTTFGGYAPARFRVDADGWVNFEGLAFNNSGVAQGGGAVICAAGGLPTPEAALPQALPTLTGAAVAILLQINADGSLVILAGSDPAGQNICLNGLRYYAGISGS